MISGKKFGYKHKREHKNPKLSSLFPIPDGEKFDMVKRMFALALDGMTPENIAITLKREYPNQQLSGLNWADKKLRDSFVDATLQPTFWPFDEKMALSCLRHRINWGSLRQAYLDSYRLVLDSDENYRAMQRSAVQAIEQCAGHEVVAQRLKSYVHGLVD